MKHIVVQVRFRESPEEATASARRDLAAGKRGGKFSREFNLQVN